MRLKRVTGWTVQGKAENGFMHLINSGASALDGSGREKDGAGNAAMKPWWDVTEKDAEECLKATQWAPANLGYFRGGGFSSRFRTTGEMPVTMVRLNMVEGIGR